MDPMTNESYWGRANRRTLSRRGVLGRGVAAGVGLLGAALIGCSSSGSESGAGGASGAGATAAGGGTTSKRPTKTSEVPWIMDLRTGKKEPKYGGTLNTTFGYGLPSVDPIKNATADTLFFHGLHSSKLVEHGGVPGTTAFEEPVVPDVAQKWEQTDPATLVFTLNPKAVWQDRAPANGRPITADDVKFTYERYMASGATKSRFEPVEKVEAVDKNTVRIKLKRPTPEILNTFAFEHHAILNPEYVASKGGDIGNGGTQYVGSGPFIHSEYQQGVRSVWVKNPNYWGLDGAGRKLPYLERINYVTIADQAAQRAAFDSGQLDIVAIDVDFFDLYAKNPSVLLGKATNGANMMSLTATHKKTPFQDVRVRRAISMSIDRKAGNDQFYGGLGNPVIPFPPKAFGKKGLPSWDELHANYKRNIPEAKKLLAAAGHANGLDVGPLAYAENFGIAAQNQTLLFAQEMKEAGITATPVKIDRNAYLERRTKGMWDGMMNISQPNPGVADQAWAERIYSKDATNYWGVNEPAADKIIETLRTTLDPNERKSLFEQLLKLEQENVYRMYTMQTASLNVVRAQVENPSVGINSLLEYKEFLRRYTWMDK